MPFYFLCITISKGIVSKDLPFPSCPPPPPPSHYFSSVLQGSSLMIYQSMMIQLISASTLVCANFLEKEGRYRRGEGEEKERGEQHGDIATLTVGCLIVH